MADPDVPHHTPGNKGFNHGLDASMKKDRGLTNIVLSNILLLVLILITISVLGIKT